MMGETGAGCRSVARGRGCCSTATLHTATVQMIRAMVTMVLISVGGGCSTVHPRMTEMTVMASSGVGDVSRTHMPKRMKSWWTRTTRRGTAVETVSRSSMKVVAWRVVTIAATAATVATVATAASLTTMAESTLLVHRRNPAISSHVVPAAQATYAVVSSIVDMAAWVGRVLTRRE